MSDVEDCFSGHQPTSEVRTDTHVEQGNKRTNEQLPETKTEKSNEINMFMRFMRGLASGMQHQSPTMLVKFDPDDPDIDIVGWCKINELIIKDKKLKGTDLLLTLTQALRGRAASCLTKICPDTITWENVKEHLIARFSKPLQMQDYFEQVIKFKINNKETAADAAMRLWHLIESIPKVEMCDEAIIGFVVTILSQIDNNIKRELNSHNITNKSHLWRILNSTPLKRHTDDINTYNDNKRPRYTRPVNFTGFCHRCGEQGHKIINCSKNNFEIQPSKTRYEEKRSVTCFACGKPGHVASICTQQKSSSPIITKEVKLCSKQSVTGELNIAGILIKFLFDSGSECSLIKKGIADKINGIKSYETICFVGIGKSNVICNEQINCTVVIQNVTFKILFHIIQDTYLVEPIILGRDIIDLGIHVKINSNGVTVLQSKQIQLCTNSTNLVESQINTDLVGDNKTSLIHLLSKYSNSFVDGVPLHRAKTGELKIDLIDKNKVVQRRPYRLSPRERDIVKSKVSELLNAGIIQESHSPFASPILLVKKKDGSDRMVVDYRELNANTRSDNYPLPRISDQIDRLHGSNYFSTLDMTSGFHCIPIESRSVERTAFVTPDGQYEYLAMPFGLKNAPSVFQRSIQMALRNCQYAQVYIDDVLIPSLTIDQGLERLGQVLKELTNAGFSLNLRKCNFLKEQITYLGYVIKAGEIRPNPNKIKALIEINAPRTVKQVRQFIGLASYFRQFIPNFSQLMIPLYSLLQKKGEIHWTKEHNTIHKHVVSILTSEPVLAIFDPDKKTELHTDASSQGYGAILIQRSDKVPHVIAYFSRRTTEAESRYHSYELETLAVVRAVENFRHYLYGRHFTVRTDCNALKSSSTKRDLTPRVHRWWAILQGYNFNIEYKEGRYMSHADFFSRNPLPDSDAIENNSSTLKRKHVQILDLQQEWIAVEQQRDSEITEIMTKWRAGDLTNDIASSYDIRKGILYRKIQLNKQNKWLPIVPKSLAWSLISHVHAEIKHLGFDKTLDKLYDSYWFPGMRRAVKRFVDTCLVCKACKNSSGIRQVQLHSIPKASCPWHTIHIDISGKLSGKSQRKEYVTVIIDSFTKYVLLRHTLNLDADSAVESLKHAIYLFGVPKRVIADQGRCFISTDFKHYCSENNIDLHFIAVGASRANGQVERVMQILKNLLTVVENSTENAWRDELGEIQLVLNTTRCRTTGYTPTQLMFGINALSPGLSKISCRDDDIINNRSKLSEIRNDAAKNIKAVAKSDTERFNKTKALIKSFKAGDFVYLKSSERNKTKLDRSYRGPFKIIGVLDNDRYELQQLDGSKRVYKYPHESLREIPRGRAGLTELAEALSEQAVDDDNIALVDSSDNGDTVNDIDMPVVDNSSAASSIDYGDTDGDNTVTVWRICDDVEPNDTRVNSQLAEKDDDNVIVWRVCDTDD